MLIEFSVANFRSIHARQTLSLVAGADKRLADRNIHSKVDKGLDLLRTAVIYGANAAGKSNLLRAAETLRQLVQNSAVATQEGQKLNVTPFLLNKASSAQPCEFEIIFIADDGVRYQYECAVTKDRIVRESLVAYPQGRAQKWFERECGEGDGRSAEVWYFGASFKASPAERKVWQEFTRSNALFLSTAIQLNSAQLRPAFNWITQGLIVLIPGIQMNPFLSIELLQQPHGAERIMQYMRAADIGIDRLEPRIEEVPAASPINVLARTLQQSMPGFGAAATPDAPTKQIRVIAWHKSDQAKNDVAIDLAEESDGTQKLFEFIGGWLRALDSGATLLVDELDRSLHPHLTRFLVGIFHGKLNEKRAQLVFTTHDTTLLDTDLMRRDQIWFVEKDKASASHFYSLLEYSPRAEEAIERGYLKGRYGAIPFIGKLEL